MLHTAATLRYEDGISLVLSVKCQPSKLSASLRVDNEHTTPRQTERKQSVHMFVCVHKCVCVRVCLCRVVVWGSELLCGCNKDMLAVHEATFCE